MKKKWLAALLAGFTLVSVGLSGCGGSNSGANNGGNGSYSHGQENKTDEELIRIRIEEFLFAYNAGDFDEVMSCLTAKSRNAFQALLSILGAIAGNYTGIEIDLSDLFSLGIATESGDFMGLEILDVKVNGSTAVATTKMNLVGGMNNQTIYFEMKYEKGGWYIDDMTDVKQGVAENPEQSQTNVSVSDVWETGGGIIEIEFTKEGEEETYIGYANQQGEIFYSFVKPTDYSVSSDSTGEGTFSVRMKEKNTSKAVYKLINAKGEETATSENGNFDEVIGGGDGLALVYKNTGNITKTEHSYGVINVEDGSWVKPLKAAPEKLPVEVSYSSYFYKYYGNGVFALVADTDGGWGSNEEWYFYNSNTDQVFFMTSCTIGTAFENGKFYVQAYDSWGGAELYDNFDYENEIETPAYFTFIPDGTIEEIAYRFSAGNGNILLDTHMENEYLKIIDAKENTVIEYKEFPLEMMVGREFFENYILLKINGADGKRYFTVIDSEGTQVLEPRIYSSKVYFSEGYIVYETEGQFIVMDLQGNTLYSISSAECYSVEVTNGLIKVALTSGDRYYTDMEGNPLTYTLK